MLKQKNINWGKIVKSATYSEIRLNHSALIPAVPTMYSPDGSQIYLYSLDIAIKIDDRGAHINWIARTLTLVQFWLSAGKKAPTLPPGSSSMDLI